nr:hypothetical protein [Saccharomonospora cyanea]
MSDTSRNLAIGVGAVVVLAVIGTVTNGGEGEVKTTTASADTNIAADIGSGFEETSEAPSTAEVPDVEGELLSTAYGELGDAGFRDVEVVPVDGHAVAINYANWKVVEQTPTGRRDTDTEIRLKVVKTDEAESSFCFDGDC